MSMQYAHLHVYTSRQRTHRHWDTWLQVNAASGRSDEVGSVPACAGRGTGDGILNPVEGGDVEAVLERVEGAPESGQGGSNGERRRHGGEEGV